MPGRFLLAALFIIAGSLHFRLTSIYVSIMPTYLPNPELLVFISGAAEIFGGLGLLFSFSRQAAAWGIVALLIAVMPANVNMALHPDHWPKVPAWALWARLPGQLPLMYWAWLYTRRG